MQRAFCVGFFTLLASVAANASCDGLPAPSHDTVFDSAHTFATTHEQSLDENGIVLYDYKGEYNNLGKWPNPFFNAQYAHALYRDWIQTGCLDDSLKEKFLNHAKWLETIHESKNGMALWTYPFYNRYFDIQAGWYSGIGQATIAGVLFRAYHVSKEEKYQILGQQALEVYFRPVSEGGVITLDGGDPWIQEVPNADGPASNILNGHITGIFSLMDIRDLSGEEERVDDMVKRAIDTVRHTIATFDAGFTSFYSHYFKRGEISLLTERRAYNALHVSLLMMLYKIDGDPVFLDWAMRFQAYDEIDDVRRAMGSTDPVDHGPGEAAGWYELRYWWHSRFPTWYTVTMSPRALLSGVYLEGQTLEAMAKDLSISTYLDGARRDHAVISGNKDRQLYVRFDEPVLADEVKIDILSDNGNNNVAMVAIMPIRTEVERAAVADSCNHRTANGRYLLWDAFDDDPATRFSIFCDGYIVLPKLKASGALTIGLAEGQQPISIEISDDLEDWRELGEIVPTQPEKQSLDIPSGVFTRINLSTTLARIDGVKYESVLSAVGADLPPFVPGIMTQSSAR